MGIYILIVVMPSGLANAAIANPQTAKSRIVNCHTHIFTSDHVPPRLGRTFLPLGLHRVLTVGLVVAIGKWWFKGKFVGRIKRIKWTRFYRPFFWVAWFSRRYLATRIISNALGYAATIYTFFETFSLVSRKFAPTSGESWARSLSQWYHGSVFYIDISSGWIKAAIVLFVFLFFPSGRNLLVFVFKKLYTFLASLPGKQTKEFFGRYLNLGRFAIYEFQHDIFDRLNKQYPNGTAFVVLPMDMEFMGAGEPAADFSKQMDDLIKIKKNHPKTFLPFVFIHPERMKDRSFFDFKIVNGKVELVEGCALYNYMVKFKFSGFKIYPALGYYPFDEILLPLWRYAADNAIPIMTHCIIGTIFYRGPKRKDWNWHPVFQHVRIVETTNEINQLSRKGERVEKFASHETGASDEVETAQDRQHKKGATNKKRYEYSKLRLPELDNVEFQRNFTHPLNYLCLLHDRPLKKLVDEAENSEIRKLFYSETGEFRGLGNLKICFGHYGGDDEWKKYFEFDRQDFVHQLVTRPEEGIRFFDSDPAVAPGRIAQLWSEKVDWYSIISSIILQYPNVYADISYIIHNPEIIPLLKQTLSSSKLRTRVLFGTDFYVVRNHKSERNMLAEIQAALSEEEFDLISRSNPIEYLNTDL